MSSYREIEGDLIVLAKQGMFDVIAHGCNCFCTMRRGIAPQMAKAFGCDVYPKEKSPYKGDVNKLSTIDYKTYSINTHSFQVVNAYTQYHYNWKTTDGICLDYTALRMCMKKINMEFQGAHVGLPKIGAGVAGGDWEKIKAIIQEELVDCDVTVVIYKEETNV